MTLMMGYGKNYNLKFPAPPIPSLLLTYLKDLALTRNVPPSRNKQLVYSVC